MNVLEAAGNLPDNLASCLHWHRAAGCDGLRSGFSLDILHDQIMLLFMLKHIQHFDNIGMVEITQSFSFSSPTLWRFAPHFSHCMEPYSGSEERGRGEHHPPAPDRASLVSAGAAVSGHERIAAGAQYMCWPPLIDSVEPVMKAASSALPCFTGRVSCTPTAPAPTSPPKPPRMTLKNERFMPLHMM